MIERFNFYDVYGYVIPGTLLLLILWLPHAIASGHELPSSATSAVVAVIVAYVTGHILQVVANKTVPSKRAIRGADGKLAYRFPSDYLFDDDNQTFTAEQKSRVGEKIKNKFGVAKPASAFLSCRNALQAAKVTSYAEQFQGMYVLMRGICAAAAIGLAYMIGCLWQQFVSAKPTAIVGISLVVIIAAIFRHELPRSDAIAQTSFAILLSGITVCAGLLAGAASPQAMLPISITAVVLTLVMLWTFGAYQAFAEQFAKTVYLDFDLLDLLPPKSG